MRIIYQGDHHLFDRAPKKRKDKASAAQFAKLSQLVGWSHEYDAQLAFGGDLYDKANPSAWLVNRTISVLRKGKPALTVLGQHEMPNHSPDVNKSPVMTLHEAGVLKLINDVEMIQGVAVHPKHWDTEPTPPVDGAVNILLGHVPVYEDNVPFFMEEHEDCFTQKTLKERYPGYDYYLCGDIHIPMVKDNVIVSGPMMRRTIDHKDYNPRAYMIDTEDGSITPLYYGTEEDVFLDIEEELQTEEIDMTQLLEVMNQSVNLKENFKRDCLTLTKKHPRANEITKEIFDEIS